MGGGRIKLGAEGWFGGCGGNSGKCQESLHWSWMERKSRIGKISNRVVISFFFFFLTSLLEYMALQCCVSSCCVIK